MAATRGPVDSWAEPFDTVLGYFPEGLDTPPDAGLVFDWGSMTATERAIEDTQSMPGLDAVRMQGVFQTAATFDELTVWVESRFVGKAPWVIDIERHEAFFNLAMVKGHRLSFVAADEVKLRAA